MFVYEFDNLSPRTRVATEAVGSIVDTPDGNTDEIEKETKG